MSRLSVMLSNAKSLPLLVSLLSIAAGTHLSAQVIDLTVSNVGIAIGDKPEMTGLRLNYRDRNLREITGINATIWAPHDPAEGVVNGVAIGLPTTGAGTINGLSVAVLGAGATHKLAGLGVSLFGFGAGGEIDGIYGGALGVGAGGSVSGLAVGGLGVGAGRSFTGIGLGGLGVGAGSDVHGIAIGGLGVGAGGEFTGLGIGGLGVGAGGQVKGILIGGLGVGAGGDVTGVSFGGFGVGSGGTIRGLAMALGGVGAPKITGLTISAAAGGENVHAIVLAPAYFTVSNDGSFNGFSLSAYNRVRGAQSGLTIGIVNYARELHGAQVGVLNISDNDGRRRVLPIVSVR